MSLIEFHLLSEAEKIALLYNEGVYVGKRKQNKKIVVLYQLDSFYIEIFYRKYRQHILHIHLFTSPDELQPYLQQINVEELIKCVS